jgi:hypothetical protein
MRISANGGTPEQIAKLEKNEANLIDPQILPDGKSIMFTCLPAPFRVMVQSLETGERRELFKGNTAKYLPTGHILYGSGNDLYAVRFDPNALRVIGAPVLMVEGVLSTLGASQYAVSESGSLVYLPGNASTIANYTLVWVDRNGREESIAAQPSSLYSQLRVSPDGTRVALV